MFSQLSEQVKKSSQPVSDLFAANVEALQAVSKQQTSFVSGFLQDSIKLMQTVAQQTETEGFLAAQSVYAESVRERLTSTTKITYSTLSEIGQQVAEGMKTSFENARVQATTPLNTTPAKVVSAKKTMPAKKASSAKPATPKANASVASAKKAPVKKASAPVQQTATKTTASKAAVAPKVVTQKPEAVKAAAKPVPKLSADNVRAVPKKVVETNPNTTSTENTSKA